MAYPATLIGFSEGEDADFLELLRKSGHIGGIDLCGDDLEQAAALQNESLSRMFFISTRIPPERIAAFTGQLLRLWHRGVLVGARNDALAAFAIQSNQYAAYMETPVTAEKLEAALEQLQYWRNQWLGVRAED